MICHYLSSLIEFFVLKGNNEDFARADSSSENLYRILVILLIGWPFVYVGFFYYQFKHEDKYNYSLWGFKLASMILDVFLLAYTIYVTATLQGDLGAGGTFIVTDISTDIGAFILTPCVYFVFAKGNERFNCMQTSVSPEEE